MLTTLEMVLSSIGGIRLDYNSGSLFHGVIMEKIDKNFAEIIHNQGLKPYSQNVIFDRKNNVLNWKISTVSEDARMNIIEPICNNNFDDIYLSHKDSKFRVLNKKIVRQNSYKEMADKCFASGDCKRKVKLKFLTPTSFKVGGEYQIFPNINNIYGSLASKWNSFSDEISIEDDETLGHLIVNTKMTGYNLKSTFFHLEGIKIKSFIGEIELYISGPEALVRLANMLFTYAEYSGVGIKNSLGMGGVEIE